MVDCQNVTGDFYQSVNEYGYLRTSRRIGKLMGLVGPNPRQTISPGISKLDDLMFGYVVFQQKTTIDSKYSSGHQRLLSTVTTQPTPGFCPVRFTSVRVRCDPLQFASTILSCTHVNAVGGEPSTFMFTCSSGVQMGYTGSEELDKLIAN